MTHNPNEGKRENTSSFEFNLGSEWTKDQIIAFFNAFKLYGGDDVQNIHQEMEEKGEGRSLQQIKSMILKNKTYLSLKSASANDLVAIMSDYYSTPELAPIVNNNNPNKVENPRTPEHGNKENREYIVEQENFIFCEESLSIQEKAGMWGTNEVKYYESKIGDLSRLTRKGVIGRLGSNTSSSSIPIPGVSGGFEMRVGIGPGVERERVITPIFHKQGATDSKRAGGGWSGHRNQILRQREQMPSGSKGPYIHNTNTKLDYETGPKSIYKKLFHGAQYPTNYYSGASSNRKLKKYEDRTYFYGEPPNNLRRKETRWNRRGLQDMDPYSIITDEAEILHNPSLECGMHFPLSRLVNRWIFSEWFYSWVDKAFFISKPLKDTLMDLGIPSEVFRDDGNGLNRYEWGVIKSSLGKPRRFSKAFITHERAKLKRYREIFRHGLDGNIQELTTYPKSEVEVVRKYIYEQEIVELTVGQRVLAKHPKSKEIKTGTILTAGLEYYHIQFDKAELGVSLVRDTELMPINEFRAEPPSQLHPNQSHHIVNGALIDNNTHNNPNHSTTNPLLLNQFSNISQNEENMDMVTKEDICENQSVKSDEGVQYVPFEETYFTHETVMAMSLLITLLDRKNTLIKELKKFNDILEIDPQYTEEFRQQYAWTGIQLQATNAIIEPVLTKFRLRHIREEWLKKMGRVHTTAHPILEHSNGVQQDNLFPHFHSGKTLIELLDNTYFKLIPPDMELEIKEEEKIVDNSEEEVEEMSKDLQITKELKYLEGIGHRFFRILKVLKEMNNILIYSPENPSSDEIKEESPEWGKEFMGENTLETALRIDKCLNLGASDVDSLHSSVINHNNNNNNNYYIQNPQTESPKSPESLFIKELFPQQEISEIQITDLNTNIIHHKMPLLEVSPDVRMELITKIVKIVKAEIQHELTHLLNESIHLQNQDLIIQIKKAFSGIFGIVDA